MALRLYSPSIFKRGTSASASRERKRKCCASAQPIRHLFQQPPFLKNLFYPFLFLSPSRKIYLKTCVLVGCWWTIDGSLSLFCSASFIPSFRMFTPRTHSSIYPIIEKERSQNVLAISNHPAATRFLYITSDCVRSTLIISRPLSPYVHDALR